MSKKMIVGWEEYKKIVEKLAIEIHKSYKPTVLIGIMRGAAPIIDILSRILKIPIKLFKLICSVFFEIIIALSAKPE